MLPSRVWVHCPRASNGLLPPRSYLVGYMRWHARSDSSFVLWFLLQTIIPTAFSSQTRNPSIIRVREDCRKPEVIRLDETGCARNFEQTSMDALIRTPALGVVSPYSAQRLFDRLPAPIPNEACSPERYGPASQERDARRTAGRGKRPPAGGEPSSSAQLSSVGTQFL